MDGAPAGKEFNPLLVLVFCPHCVLSGLFALAATGVVTLPALFGVGLEWYLAPAIIVGGFLTWLAWGRWERRKECTLPAARADEPPSATP